MATLITDYGERKTRMHLRFQRPLPTFASKNDQIFYPIAHAGIADSTCLKIRRRGKKKKKRYIELWSILKIKKLLAYM